MTRLLPERKSVTINALTVFAIVTFGLHVFTLTLLVFQGLSIYNLTNRKPPTFVQVIGGKNAPPTDNLQRDPEAIRQFVSQTMVSMFNWTGTLPPENIEDATNPKADTGVTIKTLQGLTKRVATSSWIASFALAEDFRQAFLAQIADMTPPEIFSNISNNKKLGITGKLTIQRVYPPEKISPGRWRVGMVASIIQTKHSNNKKVLTPFNKDFLIRAVDSFEHPLSNNISQQQNAVYRIRSYRLEIYEVTDLCLTDNYDASRNQLRRCGSTFNTNRFTQ
jgi:hypothetical protein